jgi:hypothetical protein
MTSSEQNTTTVRAQAIFILFSCNSELRDVERFDEVVGNIFLMWPYLLTVENGGVEYGFTIFWGHLCYCSSFMVSCASVLSVPKHQSLEVRLYERYDK